MIGRPPTWKHSVTKVIRVPEAYADALIALAHQWEAGDIGSLREFHCPDCGEPFQAIDARWDKPLYRFSEEAAQFVEVTQ